MQQKNFSSRFVEHLRNKTIIAAIVLTALFINYYLYPFIPSLTQQQGPLIWLIIGVLLCLLTFYCGSYIFHTAWTALKFSETNKNTLIALGTLILLIYSMLRIFFPHYLAHLFRENYFISAIMIIMLGNIATLLELRAKRGNEFLLERLRHLLPQKTIKLHHDAEIEIAVNKLQIGDIIKANPGDTLIADGIIVKGQTKVKQTALNGDPIPQQKNCGDEVLAGSLNKINTIYYKITYLGKHTILAHIIKMVSHAQISKTRSGRFMEIFTAVFIPIVLLIALLTLLTWYYFGPTPHYVHAMLRAVTVLVIASPTALAISIPLPILMGIGKAAEYGILVRNAQTLVKTARINTAIFDKSGILTQGKPYLLNIHTKRDCNEDTLLQIAASVENRYEHPIANAIVQTAHDRNIELLPVENFNVIPGQGISADIANKHISIGNRQFMQQQNIILDDMSELAQRTTQQGYTTLLVAVDQKVLGLLTLQDELRKDTRDAIMRLNKLGVHTVMFTADNRAAAENLGRRIGIKQIFADISSQGKLKEIEKLQQQGEIVALVAEGATDALALARADISIAIANHHHLMLDTANINLMRNSLHGIADIIRIARTTRHKIKQNLSISLLYNVIAIFIATGLFYPVWSWLLQPISATILMILCALSIILNTKRLLHFKPFKPLRKR